MHLTIAIATWNRAERLAETLASLALLRVPRQVTWDVLVCDNNSTDGTKQVVQQATDGIGCGAGLKGKQGLTGVGYRHEPTQGKSHALNHLLREAKGEWVLMLDDDVLVDEHWLAAYVDAIHRYPRASVLGGAVLPRLLGPIDSQRQFLLRTYPAAFGVLELEADIPIAERVVTPGGANMAVRREVALQIGYNTGAGMFPGQRIAGEDATMALEILKHGHEGWMLAGAKVLHWTPAETLTTKQLWRWQKGIGRSWVLYRGKPKPGWMGVAWWAWREMLRRYARALLRWRPWPSRTYFDAVIEAAQYWGYLTAK